MRYHPAQNSGFSGRGEAQDDSAASTLRMNAFLSFRRSLVGIASAARTRVLDAWSVSANIPLAMDKPNLEAKQS